MKPCLVLPFVIGFFLNAAGVTEEPQTPAKVDASAMMAGYLNAEAKRLDGRFLEGINSREEWEAKRGELKEEYLEMLGLKPLPERTPLHATVTGIIERKADGFRVEKLWFQSRPGLYVTGNLYLPADAKGGSKLPGILYVCGHSGRGRDGNKTAFQHHGMWFATHGYVCLIIDTLQLGEIAAIHHGTYRYNRWWWQSRGYTPAGVECWNGIRAIDYLQSRPEVDGERIGVTGISGGGAATFWIAAADDRVKVAVPVSGMSDLEDYVGQKVVNGHCDCMFLINTFRRPWTDIAALIVPRPMLFENSGHDTIFPMDGNERIRARLERLYGLYTKKPAELFDIGVTPGGHDDNQELRLMAYRWMNRFLKGSDEAVTEPELAKIEGKELRAFPEQLPRDELNTQVDEMFVPKGLVKVPESLEEFRERQASCMKELRRIVFRDIPERQEQDESKGIALVGDSKGVVDSEAGIKVGWRYFPPEIEDKPSPGWICVLGQKETLEAKPDWLEKVVGQGPVLLVAPRGSGSFEIEDPAPFHVHRSLPLLGRTLDSCKVVDVLAVARGALATKSNRRWMVAGKGDAGVIAAYAALLEPGLAGVLAVDPPVSHREGPVFLNILRVMDIPDAFGMLAPRELSIRTGKQAEFDRTARWYEASGKGTLFRRFE